MGSLDKDLAAFLDEHRRCSDFDASVDDGPPGCIVWIECSRCGGRRIARHVEDDTCEEKPRPR